MLGICCISLTLYNFFLECFVGKPIAHPEKVGTGVAGSFLLPSLFAFVFSSPCFLYLYLAGNWHNKTVFCAKPCKNIFNNSTGNSFVIKYLFLNTFISNKAKERKNIFSLQLKQYISKCMMLVNFTTTFPY